MEQILFFWIQMLCFFLLIKHLLKLGWFKIGYLSLFFAIFLTTNTTQVINAPTTTSYLLTVLKISMISLSIFLPVIIVNNAFQLTELSRGMLQANYYQGGGQNQQSPGLLVWLNLLLYQYFYKTTDLIGIQILDYALLKNTPNSTFQTEIAVLTEYLLNILNRSFGAGMALLACYFLSEMLFMVLNRILPQVSFNTESFSLKHLILITFLYIQLNAAT